MAQLSHSPVYIKLGQLLTHLVVRNKPLISTTGGRFPRAWLEPPRWLRSLWGLKAHAIPAGFAAVRSNQRGSVSDRYTYASTWNMRDSCGKRGLSATSARGDR